MRLSLCETDKDEMQEAAIEERQMVLGMEEQRAIKHAKKLAVEEDLQSIEFEYRCLVGQDCALEDGIETAMEAQQQRRETNLKRVEDMLETEQAIASEQVNHLKRQMEEMEWHSERLEEEIQKLQSKCELHDMRRKNLIRGNNMDLTLDLQLERGKRKTQFGNQRIALLLDSGSEDDSRLHQPRWVSVLHDELDALHRQLTITRDLYLEAVQDEQEAVLDMLTPRSGDSHLSDHQLLQRLFDAAARYGQSNKERTRESEIMDLERRVSLQRKEAALLQERLDQNHSAEHIELQDSRGEHQELQQQLEELHGEAQQLRMKLERSEPFVKQAELLRTRLAGTEAREMQILEDGGQIARVHDLLALARLGESQLRSSNEEQQNLLRNLQASSKHLHIQICDASKAEAKARHEHAELRQAMISLEADAGFMKETQGVQKQHRDAIVKELKLDAYRLKQQLAAVEARFATQRFKKHDAQQDTLNLQAVAQQLSSQLAEARDQHLQERQQLVQAVSELRTVAHQWGNLAMLRQQMDEPRQSTKREKHLMLVVAELQDQSSHLHRQLESRRFMDKQQQSRKKANERHIQRLCALVDELDCEVGRASGRSGGHKTLANGDDRWPQPWRSGGIADPNSNNANDAELLRMLRTVRLVDGDLG